MLRRDEHAHDLDRADVPVLVGLVADRHLGLPVGPQVRQDVGLAHLGEPAADQVRQHDRHRHQLVGLVARVAEHHPLVARTLTVERIGVAGVVLRLVGRIHALRDVGRLLVQRDDHAARVGVEAVLRAVVADLADLLAHEPRDVDVRLGRDLAGDHDEPGRDQRLARDTPQRILGEDGVEDRVRDLVGHLVGVPLGDGLRREQERARGHDAEGYRTPTKPSTDNTDPPTVAYARPVPKRRSLGTAFDEPPSFASNGRAVAASP